MKLRNLIKLFPPGQVKVFKKFCLPRWVVTFGVLLAGSTLIIAACYSCSLVQRQNPVEKNGTASKMRAIQTTEDEATKEETQEGVTTKEETAEDGAIKDEATEEEATKPAEEQVALSKLEQKTMQKFDLITSDNIAKWKNRQIAPSDTTYTYIGTWLFEPSLAQDRMKNKTLREGAAIGEKRIVGKIKKQFQKIFVSISEQTLALKRLHMDTETRLTLEEALPNAWPIKGARVTSRFGWRRNPFTHRGSEYHRGMDLAAANRTPVRAAGAGVVTFAGYKSAWGNVVIISHGHGYVSQYAHNSRILVRKGERVTRGKIIARVGQSGRATGPHLHFGVSKDGKWIDPLTTLKK